MTKVSTLHLKYAGSKAKVLPQLTLLLPDMKKIHTYVEPFCGAMHMGLYILERYPKLDKYYFSDVNKHLINTYRVIRDNLDTLLSKLQKEQERYDSNSLSDNEKIYYEMRNEFNNNHMDSLTRAVYFIYFNRTCYNGLWRTNRKGGFNVAFGKYKQPHIYNPTALARVSNLINRDNVYFSIRSYEKDVVVDHGYNGVGHSGIFYYLDPPYVKLEGKNSFTSYCGTFDKNEQERLAYYYKLLDKCGCKLMMSNSYDPNSDFLNFLYKDYYMYSVEAARLINSNAEDRRKVKESVILNYSKEGV